MTLNHQNKIRNYFFSPNKHILRAKSHQKDILHLFLLVFTKNTHFFRKSDLQIDPFTLKMSLNHQNNS